MSREPHNGDPVEITWIDSATKHGWQLPEQLPTDDDMHARTVGIYVGDSEGGVTVALGSGQDGDYLCPQVIPKVAIRSIAILGGEAATMEVLAAAASLDPVNESVRIVAGLAAAEYARLGSQDEAR